MSEAQSQRQFADNGANLVVARVRSKQVCDEVPRRPRVSCCASSLHPARCERADPGNTPSRGEMRSRALERWRVGGIDENRLSQTGMSRCDAAGRRVCDALTYFIVRH
jgi:hypothetical protein